MAVGWPTIHVGGSLFGGFKVSKIGAACLWGSPFRRSDFADLTNVFCCSFNDKDRKASRERPPGEDWFHGGYRHNWQSRGSGPRQRYRRVHLQQCREGILGPLGNNLPAHRPKGSKRRTSVQLFVYPQLFARDCLPKSTICHRRVTHTVLPLL